MTNEEKILQLLESQQIELRKINSRLDGMESRLGGMESRLDGMESRLDGMESRFDGMESRFDGMESRLDKLEESAEVTRGGINTLIEWAENVSNAIRFPLPKL